MQIPSAARVLRPALALAFAASLPAMDAGAAFFESRIRPLLIDHCLRCHGGESVKGGLRLDSRAAILRGGDGGPGAVVGQPDISRIVIAARYADRDLRMPPKQRLAASQAEDLAAWVRMGLPWPTGPALESAPTREHWAFAPLREPAIPAAAGAQRPIDRFVQAGLAPHGATLAPALHGAPLLRRLTVDLTGLPPAPAEVEAFLAAAASPAGAGSAYEQAVDRLLASEDFGERWARHWLDVARYADSAGYSTDADRPHAWPYRDFVIGAFNGDLPYDRFVRMQVAGDRIAPGDRDGLAATGFCTAGPFNTNRPKEKDRLDELDDQVATTGLAFLGLTIGCARCHDHKSDPLTARDYYRLTAVFASAKRGDIPLPGGKDRVHGLTAGATSDVGRWLLTRGDPEQRKERMEAGFIAKLVRAPERDRRWLDAASGDARRALADWLVDVEHGAGALAARVIVNRLWQHHFGAGLVRTPNDFGTQGDAPSHPELLDWLAARLVAGGWKLKPIHRLIVTSATYRQGADGDRRMAASDGGNRLLWRRGVRRLEAEAVRDALLAASGALNRTRGGPAVKPHIDRAAIMPAKYATWPADARDDAATWRRGIYVFSKRSVPFPFLVAFDQGDSTASRGERSATCIVPQALHLMNDPFTVEQVRLLAERVAREAGEVPAARVRLAWLLCYARPPAPAEAERALRFMASWTGGEGWPPLRALCHSLVCANEFIHVE